jgi:cell division protein FtsB
MNARVPDAAPTGEPRRPIRRRLTAEEVRKRRDRWIARAVWAGFAFVLINGIVGESGYLATIRAERQAVALRVEVARLRIENQRLRDDRIRLEHDPSALEEAARRQGMIRDGETIVTIRDRVPAGSAERPQ